MRQEHQNSLNEIKKQLEEEQKAEQAQLVSLDLLVLTIFLCTNLYHDRGECVLFRRKSDWN